MFGERKRLGLGLFVLLAAIVLVACQSQTEEAPSDDPAPVEEEAAPDTDADADAPAEAEQASVADDWPDISWEEVVAQADGGTVNWFHWGGSAEINAHIAEDIGNRVQEEFNITLNPVHINDTVEAVNLVLGEVEAGVTEDGSVDMIWINGENFQTLRQADLLFGPYAMFLPNTIAFTDPDWTFSNFDFGYPIEGYESLLDFDQAAIEYDSAVLPDPPRSIPDYVAWACENPGLTTYSAPPDFTGTSFLTPFFYHYTGGHEQWQGEWNAEKQALFDEKAPAVWDVLNELEPCLWRGGETYAVDPTQLEQLMGNGEILIGPGGAVTHAAQQVQVGTYPESIRTLVWEEGTNANASYVAIPANSPNLAAALVLANFLLEPEMQLMKTNPEVWGTSTVLDMTKVSEEMRAAFDAVDLGVQTLPPSERIPSVPPMSAEMLPIFEAAWRENVLEN